jgi:hypothetical protein
VVVSKCFLKLTYSRSMECYSTISKITYTKFPLQFSSPTFLFYSLTFDLILRIYRLLNIYFYSNPFHLSSNNSIYIDHELIPNSHQCSVFQTLTQPGNKISQIQMEWKLACEFSHTNHQSFFTPSFLIQV